MTDEPIVLVLLSTEPLDRAAVAEFATGRGLSRLEDPAWTDGGRRTTWVKGDTDFSFNTVASSGRGVFVVFDSGTEFADDVKSAFRLVSPDAALQTARTTEKESERIEAIFAIDTLLRYRTSANAELEEWLAEQLLDPRDLVRWAAADRLGCSISEEAELAFAAAMEQYPELAAHHQWVVAKRRAAAEGTIGDEPTDSWQELLERAHAGVADGQFVRVAQAMDQLLEECPDHVEGLHLRGLAHEAAGELALALGLFAASDQARSYRDEEEVDSALVSQNAESQVRVSDRLRSESGAQDVDAVLQRMNSFRTSYHPKCEAAMAAALCEHLDSAAPLLHLLAGEYHNDGKLLEQALQIAPDSPSCLAALGVALAEEDPERSDALLERALEQIDDSSQSPAEHFIRDYMGDDAMTGGEVLAVLTQAAYDRADWERAGELADAWVEADPRSTIAWQIRPNARTFALRHDEAAELYVETLEVLEELLRDDGDSIYFGDDARAAMQFNLACVLAKLGRREESLDALRHAVRGDECWAERAVEDDYFGALLEDEEFRKIVDLDPGALVFDHELRREHLEALVSRALGKSHLGYVDEALDDAQRATELAELAGLGDLAIKALNIQATTLALHGDPGLALELSERAIHLAQQQQVEEALLAETTHYHGVALHAAGQLERGREALDRALQLRREHYGEAHPFLAKSYGDIARLSLAMGEHAQAIEEMCAGLNVLERYFERADSLDEEYPDALLDRAILLNNLAHLAASGGDDEKAVELLDRTVVALEAVYADGYLLDHIVDGTAALADEVGHYAESDEHSEQCQMLLRRLDDLLLDEEPEVRAEQQFWKRLRQIGTQLRAMGVSGEQYAEILISAIKGDDLSAELLEVPELGGFANALAQRVQRISTLALLAPIALDTARLDGDVDGALIELEGLCVAALREEAVI